MSFPGSVGKPRPRLKFRPHSWATLNLTQARVAEQLSFLAACRGRDSPSGARYATPSQRYLAHQVGRCERTVRRAVRRLKQLQAISVTHRRRVQGVWQSNLYTVAKWVHQAAAQFTAVARALSHHRTQVSDKLPPQKVERCHRGLLRGPPVASDPPEMASRPLGRSIQSWLDRVRAPKTAPVGS
jgi:hypothetical protein